MTIDHLAPFLVHLGIRCTRAADGEAELRASVDDAWMNSWNCAHGGALATMLDASMSFAGRSLVHEGQGGGSMTLNLNVQYLQPGRGELIATARVVHRSATLLFCDSAIHDAAGELIATAQATLKRLPRLRPFSD